MVLLVRRMDQYTPPPKKKHTNMSKINLDFLLHFMHICQNKAYFLHKSTRETLGLNKIKRIANINSHFLKLGRKKLPIYFSSCFLDLNNPTYEY